MSQKNEEDNSNNAASIRRTPHADRARNATMDLRHKVFNVVEIIACEKITDMMDRLDVCTCMKCTCDVLALALNSLPTKYVTSHAGKQYIQLDAYKKQFETDVEIALMKACLTVKSAPNHDE